MEIWQAICLILNSSSAIILNMLIFYLVYRKTNLRTPFNATILNACFADILVSVNQIVSTVHMLSTKMDGSDIGAAWCDVTGFVNLLSFVASVISMAAVSVNRYFLICQRHIYSNIFTKRGTSLYILSVWICSILLSIPPLLGWGRFTYHQAKSICFADWNSSVSYMTFMISICFCGPITATLLSLYFILRIKRKIATTVLETKDDFGVSEVARNRMKEQKLKREKEERKITLSIVAVVVVFFVAWGPFVVVMFVEVIGKYHIPEWADFGSLFLGCLNSTANPIIYLTLNGNFRKSFRRLFTRETFSDNGFSIGTTNT